VSKLKTKGSDRQPLWAYRYRLEALGWARPLHSPEGAMHSKLLDLDRRVALRQPMEPRDCHRASTAKP
jgi:hypothetical protein